MSGSDIVGLYNYWIVIFLMMTGFYIVLARKNLIKSVIGLNIFQTSVFLLYITMGKIQGGTAPIIPPDLVADSGHHASQHGSGDDHGHDDHPSHDSDHEPHHDSMPDTSHLKHSESLDLEAEDRGEPIASAAQIAEEVVGPVTDHAATVIYSNPLPSVLMLTAIVVGIATTALALALVVRIREDYGTIDELHILEIDRADGPVETASERFQHETTSSGAGSDS